MLERRVLVVRPAASLALQTLLQVHLGVPLLLVRARELAAAHVARERLLARVRAHVRRQVVRPAERAHADAALERFLPRVDADVPRQFVRPREPAVAAFHRARVRSLVDGGFARPVRIFARFDRDEPQRLCTLLVHLREDLVPFARGRVVFGELHRPVAGAGRARVRFSFGKAGGPGSGLRGTGVLLRVPRVLLLLLLRRRPVLAVLRRRAGRGRAVIGLAVGWQQVHALLVFLLEVLVDAAGAGAGWQQPLQRRRGRALDSGGRAIQRRARAGRVAAVLGARSRGQ